MNIRLLSINLIALAATAAETRIWSLGDQSDFEKGKLKGVSLSSDGRITLAPAFTEIFDSASVYLWALAEDSKGNLYAGGGGPGGPGARLYLIEPSGKNRTVASLEELEIHALAIDAKDQVYAATAPDGKVYRIRNGKPEVFYNPQAKYIWGMAFNRQGELFVATGDRGEVHRVSASGKGSVFYKTSDAHARSLAFDDQDNLVLGTEPGGLIIRVDAKGQGFVLYQAVKREVTALAVARNGAIYAAAVGNKLPAAAAPAPAPPASAPAAPVNPAAPPSPHAAGQRPPVQPAPIAAPPSIPGGSELYRIDRDGFPRRIWSHPQDIVYAIAFDADQRPLVGTGNEGTLYRIDSELVHTELLNAPPAQITALYAGRQGRIYAATGNVGKVYQVGPGLEKEGMLESDVLDAGIFSHWGRLACRAALHGGRVSFATRSGNLDRPHNDWSPWSAEIPSGGGSVQSPAARFLQWRATLTPSPDGRSPVLNAVDVAYLPRNVAPLVRQIEITPANYRFPQPAAAPAAAPQSLSLPPLGAGAPVRGRTGPTEGATPSMQYAKGFLAARWLASDENADTLTFSVYLRGESETEWKPLKDKVAERYVSWDSTAFPDGEYRLRVVVSDAPDNPPDQALSAELTSDPFIIDNTPPEIAGLAATPSGNKLTVRWSARDTLSVIDHAEYSVNGGEWTVVEPVGGLSDSQQEDYLLTLDRRIPGELTIAVRVADENDNRAVAKTVIRGQGI